MAASFVVLPELAAESGRTPDHARLHVFDPDGHVLRFGAEAPKDAPLGQWLDEDGTRWQAQPGGGWTKVE